MKLKLAALRRARAGPKAVGSYRVALHGFSDFERNALSFCLKHAAAREPAYLQVERAAEADFIVADASHEMLATSVTRGTRMRDTLFVGAHAPPGARAHVERPIDPEEILRALDEMAAEREAPPEAAERPDIVLPMAASERDFPTLDESDIVPTAPAAFDRSPVFINLADLVPITRPRARGTEPDAAEIAAAEPGSALPQEPAAAPIPQSGAQGVSDAEAPDAPPSRAAPEAAALPEPAPWTPARRPRNPPALAPEDFDTISPAAIPESAPAPVPVQAPVQAPAAAKPQWASAQERAAAKAEARRRSRRARLAQAGRAGAESLCDVLLLGPERADAGLAAQLQAFGFQVRHASYSADVLALVAELPLAAVFLDVAPGSDEDMDGLELCMEIKHQRVALAGPVPPVFLLANRDSAAGRVRAKLAGCDALLIRPVTRGDAARALEACDVALPKDERRIERS
jgi:CheY-like chemotaxis protein